MGCCYIFPYNQEYLTSLNDDSESFINNSLNLKSLELDSDKNQIQSQNRPNTNFKCMSPISFIATMDLPESDCDISMESWKNVQAFKS